MMVLFVSQSTKKAQMTVRRILDNFADRIGDDVWRTIITADGVETVKVLLKRNASKNMAVACHWIRARNRDDLLWIVGRRDAFNEYGRVPVNYTNRDILHQSWENDWVYLPIVSILAALAALFHDWGKASDYFQNKLERCAKTADPYRHEWVSCRILEAVIACSDGWKDDRKWLSWLAQDNFDTKEIEAYLQAEGSKRERFSEFPPLASVLVWLILSHHRLPSLEKAEQIRYKGKCRSSIASVLQSIHSNWGYENLKLENPSDASRCFTFSRGLLWEDAPIWKKNVKKWCSRALVSCDTLQELISEKDMAPALRRCLSDARLGLMLGDHYHSSLAKAKDQSQWGARSLWANTVRTTGQPKQYLEEHLVGVMRQALKIIHRLPSLADTMERTYDVRALKKRSPPRFRWQDRTVDKIHDFVGSHEEDQAFFVVNMASTGCGKTMANAKIMEALSPGGESLRYVLALGLRSLTLQTGDEYRERIGLSPDELAVVIGSTAVLKLHEQDKSSEQGGSLSGEDGDLTPQRAEYIDTAMEKENPFLGIFFDPDHQDSASKNSNLLFKPVLVTTIDHMMGAVETIRGGRYILPGLRLMSSDLVIDEIDDFDKKDLIAIARLVHLAGMYGRNVVISSATIPPDLAEGMYRAYRAGLACRNGYFSNKKTCSVLWCDEFKAKIEREPDFVAEHKKFVDFRVRKLLGETVKRKGYIVTCGQEQDGEESRQEMYYGRIRDAVVCLHENNHEIDAVTDRKVSVGVIRMANINPCVALSHYLLQCDWPEDTEVRIMTYHSRQILLLRHEQEKYLDRVLKRKDETSEKVHIMDPVMRSHLDHSTKGNMIFILVATPVEETGRDHDLDWAVVEPSSGRSIIQLAGRIRRHREMHEDIDHENMAIMEYNIRGFRGEKRAFLWPGYEDERYILESHDMENLVSPEKLGERIDAIPRIQKATSLEPTKKLIDLEQQIMADFNSKTDTGPNCMNGWNEEYWWMTALPQQMNRFRESREQQEKLYAKYIDGKVQLCEWDEEVPCEEIYGIRPYEDWTEGMKERLWLPDNLRNYVKLLTDMIDSRDSDVPMEKQMKRASEAFGEITIPVFENVGKTLWYSDQLGMFLNEKED
jgi:CRISPR-associated endonuclease/helicase Cas3